LKILKKLKKGNKIGLRFYLESDEKEIKILQILFILPAPPALPALWNAKPIPLG
jgi:hypothetical protein